MVLDPGGFSQFQSAECPARSLTALGLRLPEFTSYPCNIWNVVVLENDLLSFRDANLTGCPLFYCSPAWGCLAGSR